MLGHYIRFQSPVSYNILGNACRYPLGKVYMCNEVLGLTGYPKMSRFFYGSTCFNIGKVVG